MAQLLRRFLVVVAVAMGLVLAAPPARAQRNTVCDCPDVYDLINRLNLAQAAIDALNGEMPKIEAYDRANNRQSTLADRNGNAWLHKPGADGAAGVGRTPQGTPVQTGNVTPLQLAAKLLEKGANPNARVAWKEPTFGKEGGTARNPPNVVLGRHLLSYIGATPFYVAAKNGDAPLMRLLADHGANPTLPTRAGITPLMVAAGLDYWEGETPGPFTGVTEAERLEAVKLAVSLGNDVNAHAHFGDYRMEGDVDYTLLYYPHNIDELLELGVGDPRWSGSTPLIGAVVSGQPSIVQYLVDQGATVDAKTVLGWTPLRVAEGVFFANAKKEFPAAAAILREAMAAQGTSVRQ